MCVYIVCVCVCERERQCVYVCVCVFEVLTHQWFVNTAKLLEVLKVSLSCKNQPKK